MAFRDLAQVYRLMDMYRRDLARRDQAALAEILRRWQEIDTALAAQIENLAREMADQKATGRPADPAAIRRSERYQSLRAQLRRRLDTYGREMSDLIEREQKQALTSGIEAAVAGLQALTGGQVAGAFDVLPARALEIMVGHTAEGTTLSTHFARKYPLAYIGMMAALVRGLALGKHPLEIARQMRRELHVIPRSALATARTEVLRVYRQASIDQYREAGIVDGYIRIAAKSERTCLACLAKDGEWFPLTVPFEEHVNGRCTTIPAPKGAKAPGIQGLAWFRNLDAETQQRMMGERRWALWQSGAFELEDIPYLRRDPTWGNSWQERSIKTLLGGQTPPAAPPAPIEPSAPAAPGPSPQAPAPIKPSTPAPLPPAPPAPALPGMGLDPLPPELRDKIRAFEHEIRYERRFETSIFIDAEGKAIFRKQGTKDQVEFTVEEAQLMAGKWLTHNHPLTFNGSSFSDADILTSNKYQALGIRAVSGMAKHQMAFNGKYYSTDHIVKTLTKISRRLKDKYDEMVLGKSLGPGRFGPPSMTPEEANVRLPHEEMRELAQALGWTYTRWLEYDEDKIRPLLWEEHEGRYGYLPEEMIKSRWNFEALLDMLLKGYRDETGQVQRKDQWPR